ncbi:hypothetical protein R3P38DRAFT_3189883 [Favolaschia claudopus]|uniref:Xylanolytic transcriptional activator regulatory domain-containing protein n=1 Tax=Favolaschia claudopus TaxID=2862362 RepID=A0AAW0BPJ8_9AGAR
MSLLPRSRRGSCDSCSSSLSSSPSVALSSSPPSSPASSNSDLPFVSESSKREYLLAQIRQKDQIIESLLKQLHNPYIATPLSIASYRMATSPSDATNRNILAWLDRLQASVRASSSEFTAANFASSASASLSSAKKINYNSPNFTSTNRASDTAFDDSDEEDGDNDAGREEEDDGEGEADASVLPDASVPFGLIANLSLSNSRGRERRGAKNGEGGGNKEDELDDLDDDNVGVANAAYFEPGPATDLGMRAQLIEQHSPPEILIHGLVVPEDVDKLFEIYYARVNPFIALLDPELHTPASTFARCPFLFTVVCAVASRYYPEKSEIYPIAMHFAKHSAATALIDGWKSVELCQAYILLSIYAVPARKWEEDRSWLYTGLAIRLATDLNLHQVPNPKAIKGNPKQERELLNRTRVWMICFNLDRSSATHILRYGSGDWYKKSQFNTKYDVHMCAYTALLMVVARFHDDIFSDASSPTGLNKHVDFRSVTIAHDAKLTAFSEEWSRRFAEDSDPEDKKSNLRCKMLPFLTSYSRLVMFSFGFQQAYQRGLQAADHIFFTKCLDSAKAVLRHMIEGLVPTGFMRYSPDGHFIFVAFASAFLLKLLRPEFSQLMPKEEESQVYDLIGRLIQTLSSPEIAIDDRHTPKLYARFLAGLLSRHRRDGATVGRLHPQPPVPQRTAGSSSSDYTMPSRSSSTTFTMSPMSGAGAMLGPDPGSHGGYQQHSYAPAETMSTPIYRQEATYSGPVQFGGVDMDLGTGLPDEEQMLAAMQALRHPNFWSNMMLPGFSWPESSAHSPASNASNGSPSPYPTQQVMGMQGIPSPVFNGSFHHPTEVPQFVA